jgi:hypothetical protein
MKSQNRTTKEMSYATLSELSSVGENQIAGDEQTCTAFDLFNKI